MWRSVPAIKVKGAAILLAALVLATGGPLRADEQPTVTGSTGVGGGLSSHISDPTPLLDKGIAAYRAGSHLEAQMTFESLVGRFPQSVEAESARQYLARIYSQMGDGRPESPQVTEPQRLPGANSSQPQRLPGANSSQSQASAHADVELVPSERLSTLLRSSVGDRVFFPKGSTDLGAHARNVLRGQASWLKRQDTSVRALVAGHADEPLDEDGNRILSARRAEAVRARLIEEGIAPDRVRVVAMGRSERVADCSSAQCAAQNRRAVTIVLERRVDHSQPLIGQSYYRPKERDGPASW
ncbi:OmpA family protein [Filomicrobium sp.]|uniref:OmpA family protein n=1 Tax=Filomicrobium sp. TaxID=2024831 RepID=UPI0025868FF5|nr:OmpA family protein [Filomicrobium sp.]MCV0368683.1 OmpA family protein [Filomicrobium sp.]